jgi:hypothetical protein
MSTTLVPRLTESIDKRVITIFVLLIHLVMSKRREIKVIILVELLCPLSALKFSV